MQTTIIGALPKLPVVYEDPDNLRRARNAFEAGRIGPCALEGTIEATQARALAWQADAAIDLPGDGQVRWQDLASPLCLDVAGMEAGGLLRFFENNTYYRQPVVTGRVALEGRTLPGWFAAARALAGRPLKAAIPGPYTLARLSEDRQYGGDLERLVGDLAEVLGLLARLHIGAGAALVEFEEPSLAGERDGGRRALALGALATAAAIAGGPVRLALYFGDPTAWLDDLADLEIDGVSFDLVEAPAVREALARDGFPGRVGLGLVNARDLRCEDEATIAGAIERIARRIEPERLLVHPNTSLEYLPADGAVQKLSLLHAIQSAVKGVAR